MNNRMHYRPACRTPYPSSQNPSQAPSMHEHEKRQTCNWQQFTKEQLLLFIDEVSLAMVDITLYLDTHPKDQNALHYFKENEALRKDALEVYAKRFGPLTVDTADSDGDTWEWVLQPWPWENH